MMNTSQTESKSIRHPGCLRRHRILRGPSTEPRRSQGVPDIPPKRPLGQLASELQMPAKAVDATDFAEVEACFSAAKEAFGCVSGGVKCVGSLLLKSAHLTTRRNGGRPSTPILPPLSYCPGGGENHDRSRWIDCPHRLGRRQDRTAQSRGHPAAKAESSASLDAPRRRTHHAACGSMWWHPGWSRRS